MITTDGKNIIAKYLLNQAPEFASHLAIGVGGHTLPTASVPYSASVSPQFSASSKSLDFEAYRVPILSKGLIKELDPETDQEIEKIVFKAELPADQRFNITEIGLFPSETNALAERFGSKGILSFTNSETWNYSRYGSASVVPYVNEALDAFQGIPVPGDITVPNTVMFINSNSSVFDFAERKNKKEEPRYLDKSLVVSGSFGEIDESFNVAASSYYLENNNVSLDLGRNLPTDQIKLALSVINKELTDLEDPDGSVRIILELINNTTGNPKAFINIDLPVGYFYDSLSDEQFRYKVITRNLSDFEITGSFSWSDIDLIRIYCSVNSTQPERYYVIFDGMRLENVSTKNPLYAMIGAEYLKTDSGYPVLKEQNSTSYIEYRFGIGVS